MATQSPIFYKFSILALLINGGIMVLLILIYERFHVEDPALYGLLTYFFALYFLRSMIPISHRRGISFVKKGQYAKAIPCFEKSLNFFCQHNWLDRYRMISMLSPSGMCYREMALNNIAFCYGQIGDIDKSISYYNETLRQYPKNPMAKAALNLINATLAKN